MTLIGCRFFVRNQALTVAAAVLAAVLLQTSALAQRGQPSPIRVVQNRVGALFLTQDSSVWPLVPDQLRQDDLAGLTPHGQIRILPVDPLFRPAPRQHIVRGGDGTLYDIVQSEPGVDGVWTLLPDNITQVELATLNIGVEIDGTVPPGLGTDQRLVPPTADQPPRATGCQAVGDPEESVEFHFTCDDGNGYVFNFAARTVAMYDPANLDAGTMQGPWPLTPNSVAGLPEWVDPVHGTTCSFLLGNGVSPLTCTGGTSSAAVATITPDSSHVPDALTDDARAAILAAVDRANAAWSATTQSLDTSGLATAVAGQELRGDLAQVDKLLAEGQTRNNVNTAFTVTYVTLDAPGHATVRTRETWYAETYDRASGRLLQRTAPATYAETYTLEYLNSGWLVTKNDT